MNIPIELISGIVAPGGNPISRTSLTLQEENGYAGILIPQTLFSNDPGDLRVLGAGGANDDVFFDALSANTHLVVVDSSGDLPATADNGTVALVTSGQVPTDSTVTMLLYRMDSGTWTSATVDTQWLVLHDFAIAAPSPASSSDPLHGTAAYPFYVPNEEAQLMLVEYPTNISIGGLDCGGGVPFGRNTIGMITDAEDTSRQHIIIANNQRGYLSDVIDSTKIAEVFISSIGCQLVLLEVASVADMEFAVKGRSGGSHSDVAFLVTTPVGIELSYWRYLTGALRLILTVPLTTPNRLAGGSMDLLYIRPLSIGPCNPSTNACEATLESSHSGTLFLGVSALVLDDMSFTYMAQANSTSLIGINSSVLGSLDINSPQGILVQTTINNTTNRLSIYHTGQLPIHIDDAAIADGDAVGLYVCNNVVTVSVRGVAKWGYVDPLGGGDVRSDTHTPFYLHVLLGVESDGHVYRNARYNGEAYRAWESDPQVYVQLSNCAIVPTGSPGKWSVDRVGPLSCISGGLRYTNIIARPSIGQRVMLAEMSVGAIRGFTDVLIHNNGTATAFITLYAGLGNTQTKAGSILSNVPLSIDGHIDLPAVPLGSGERMSIICTRGDVNILGSTIEEFSGDLPPLT